MSSPDWQVRGCEEKGGGLAWQFCSGAVFGSGAVLFWCCSGRGSSVLGVSVLVRFCSVLFCSGLVGVGAVQVPRSWDGAPAMSPPSARESAGKPVHSPRNPVRMVGRMARETRGTSWSGTTPEGLEGRSPSGRRALREVTPFAFSLGFV